MIRNWGGGRELAARGSSRKHPGFGITAGRVAPGRPAAVADDVHRIAGDPSPPRVISSR
jgi:hypothetical protein